MGRALESVAELLQRESGMTIGAERMPALVAALERAAPGRGPAALLESRPDPELLERLLDEVTVNETFFFRHAAELDAVDWGHLVATAASAGRTEVRVWSAGCATGEEAYTLAILACEALVTPRPPVSIIATDLSLRALELARAGAYRARSVRGMPEELRRRWLHSAERGYEVDPALRRLVRFERQNLVRDPVPAPGSFDLVVCRNVLIYFEPARAARVRALLESGLSRGGSLVLGAADRLCAWAESLTAPPARRQAPAVAPRSAPARPRVPSKPAAPAEILASALAAAHSGRIDEAISATDEALAADPMAGHAHFVCGVVELARGEPMAAADALRRALYLDPGHALAAFKLGRAYDTLAEPVAARRAYRRALAILDAHPATSPELPAGTQEPEVRAACVARLEALGAVPPGGERP